jgi:hypothetical protein
VFTAILSFIIRFCLPCMPVFNGGRLGFTPSLTSPNWVLDADTAGDVGQVLSIGFGGELTTSTGYRTRWVRSTTGGVGAGTAITDEGSHPGYVTAQVSLFSAYATTQPVLPAAPIALHGQSWNAHGGVGYVALPLAAPWLIINGVGQDDIVCQNLAGVDANGSSYYVTWKE